MSSVSSDAYERLRVAMSRDKALPDGFDALLFKDLDSLLRAYFEYDKSDLRMALAPLAGDGYTLNISLNAARAKGVKLL